ncbi:MurR/RpiR family transcriptional regulator [Rhizobium sp. NTR19]|uniref:MurR/RpiR family transcriptional regulator n=1 Tax=Neorhizobium turbinariae TaxID=2937795 RepID=A0ABT0IPI5_9HYPH|nr:MurR/RpiR family transcriptional regulator [Neorhizobium turbinariae]MCK8779739.1 MurR/RpiR family transcriptional regulator [Neorhizobium turbinariae]
MQERAPDSIAQFDERLMDVAESLPKRLRQCAEYVAANKDRIAISTVAELADGAGVQPSAFMRFCRILGFSGFSEMQRLFRESYTAGWPDYSTRLKNLREKAEGSPAALLAEFVDVSRVSLENLLKTVDSKALEVAVAALAKAEMIHIIGLRRSYPVASYIAYAFEKMNVPAMLHSGVGGLDNRNALRPNDVLLAVTFSPYAAETIEMVEAVGRRGIPVVAMTDTIVSPLRRFDAITLSVSEVDFGAFRSLSATLCLAITLSVAVGTARSR